MEKSVLRPGRADGRPGPRAPVFAALIDLVLARKISPARCLI